MVQLSNHQEVRKVDGIVEQQSMSTPARYCRHPCPHEPDAPQTPVHTNFKEKGSLRAGCPKLDISTQKSIFCPEGMFFFCRWKHFFSNLGILGHRVQFGGIFTPNTSHLAGPTQGAAPKILEILEFQVKRCKHCAAIQWDCRSQVCGWGVRHTWTRYGLKWSGAS